MKYQTDLEKRLFEVGTISLFAVIGAALGAVLYKLIKRKK